MAVIGTLIALKNGDGIVWALVDCRCSNDRREGLVHTGLSSAKRGAANRRAGASLGAPLRHRQLHVSDVARALERPRADDGRSAGRDAHHRNDFRAMDRACVAALGPSSFASSVLRSPSCRPFLGWYVQSPGAGDNYTRAAYAAQAFLIAGVCRRQFGVRGAYLPDDAASTSDQSGSCHSGRQGRLDRPAQPHAVAGSAQRGNRPNSARPANSWRSTTWIWIGSRSSTTCLVIRPEMRCCKR